ncbi:MULTISPECIES: PqqD family protein [Bacteria]|uniref:PqqD family protein n=1 Tax=Bacteria TaxID=2 RepID=UPI003C7E9534
MRIGDDVAWTQGAQRVVALNLVRPDAQPVVLEGTAAFVWEEIAVEAPSDLDALVTGVAQVFEVSADLIRGDVEQLVAVLRTRALIEE